MVEASVQILDLSIRILDAKSANHGVSEFRQFTVHIKRSSLDQKFGFWTSRVQTYGKFHFELSENRTSPDASH